MKVASKSLFACSLLLALSAAAIPSFANDDAAKLKALEAAIGAPAEGQTEPGKKKPRTRAIVFDNSEPAPAQGAPAAAVQSVARNCSTLNPDAPGTAVDFTIQFNVGSADIAPASVPLLDQIGKVLSLNPSTCVVVEGHTDISGNADRNTALSKSRAESVVNYLTKSLDAGRMVPVGKGSSQLLKDVAPNHPKNRRVVFKVVS